MASVKISSRYNHSAPRKYAFTPVGESMTQQQFKAECDVNNILAKYKKTGLVTHLAKHQGNFGDFSNVEDYQTSLGKLMQAQAAFGTLPSELRAKFENDPAKLIEFLSDKKNDEEAIKFGLKVRPVQKENLQQSMEKALEANDARREKSKATKKD